MAITLHSSLHFLRRHALECPVKASSASSENTGSSSFQSVSTSTRNYGRHGVSPVRGSRSHEVPTSLRVSISTPSHRSQSVDNTWSSCSSLPRGLGWRNAKCTNARHIHLSSGHVLAASTGQSSSEGPTPEDEEVESGPEEALPSDALREEPTDSTQVSGSGGDLDWRAFRARLVQSEQVGTKPPTAEASGSAVEKRWAHPILAPEAGCLLIATERLDGQQSFERTVVFLLSPGLPNNPREGPYGFILNRPISRRIKDIKPKDKLLVKQFGNCLVFLNYLDSKRLLNSATSNIWDNLEYMLSDEHLILGLANLGGPLDTDVFLLLHGQSGLQGFQEVIPGVYYGAADGLEAAAQFAKEGDQSFPQGFRFFFGYSGWGYEQLKQEIDAGLWFVAACSSELITSAVTTGLWEEVLQLMGGKYAELSKRPKRKHF